MLVGTEFVFVHVPRTGGSFISGILSEHLELDAAAERFPTHASYDELPDEFRDRSGFCLVRNPWDWYVSWYHHSMRRGPELANWDPDDPKAEIWRTAFSTGQTSFKETVTKVCEGRLEHPFARTARRRDIDLYSEFVRRQVVAGIKQGSLEAGRFEELTPFLVDFLDRRGLLSDALREAIEQSPPTNAVEHRPYPGYYDQELRELVAHKARSLIKWFGYEFDPHAKAKG